MAKTPQNTAAALFLVARAQHGLTLGQAAADIASAASLSRFESGQQHVSQSLFAELMNQVGLARQDVNNLMYHGQRLPFLAAHNETSQLMAEGKFTAAEDVVTSYEATAIAANNPLATINAIELRAKIRRRQHFDYQLPKDEQRAITKFFAQTDGVWTDHEYELFAHVASCMPLSKAFAIYQDISVKYRANALPTGYIPSLVFCTRNLLLQAMTENDAQITAYLAEDFQRLHVVPATGDIDVVFIAATRTAMTQLAVYALTSTLANHEAASRAISTYADLVGTAAAQRLRQVLRLIAQRSTTS